MFTRKKNLSLMIILVTAISCMAQGAEPVYFSDPNLKARVEQQLGVIDPTPTDMLRLNTLNGPGRGISDLTGLESALYLRTLDLSNNKIGDISALSGLRFLQTLYLGQNQIADISALSAMVNLRALRLYNNQISDVSALS